MNLITSFLALLMTAYTYNFGNNDTNNWRVVNDGVMGGLSKGVLTYAENSLIFEGELSLANNGGFASIQGPQGNYDLSDYDKVTIRHRGYGGTFGFRMKTEEPYYMPYFKMEFSPMENWTETTYELKNFDQWRLLNKTGQKISEDELSSIIRMGIIKSDKKTVPFRLEVDYIRFE
jgi:hypothetical protein